MVIGIYKKAETCKKAGACPKTSIGLSKTCRLFSSRKGLAKTGGSLYKTDRSLFKTGRSVSKTSRNTTQAGRCLSNTYKNPPRTPGSLSCCLLRLSLCRYNPFMLKERYTAFLFHHTRTCMYLYSLNIVGNNRL